MDINNTTFEERLVMRLKQMDGEPKVQVSNRQKVRNNKLARERYANRSEDDKDRERARDRARYAKGHPNSKAL